MRRLIVLVSLIATMALAAVTWTALPSGAYGGGANHDMWQVGLSFNCNNPSICNTPEFGGTGGLWGWAEFDRSADGSQTWGDAEFAFCFHTVGGGGAGAGHTSFEIESWTIEPGSAGPQTFFASGEETDTGHGTPRPRTSPTRTPGFRQRRATTAAVTSSASLHPVWLRRSRSRSGPPSSAGARFALLWAGGPCAAREDRTYATQVSGYREELTSPPGSRCGARSRGEDPSSPGYWPTWTPCFSTPPGNSLLQKRARGLWVKDVTCVFSRSLPHLSGITTWTWAAGPAWCGRRGRRAARRAPVGRAGACCQDWAGTNPMSMTVCWPSITLTTALSAVTPS